MFPRTLAGLAAVTCALLVGGCGGGGRAGAVLGAAGAAEIPGSAAAVVSLDTSFDSRATSELRSLVDRFPARDRLYGAIGSELAKQGLDFASDVEPALGPETDIVLLDVEQFYDHPHAVVLTKPDDPTKLSALLAKADQPIVHEQVDGWTVAARSRALIDRFKAERDAGPRLAASGVYRDATASLPGDALATVYVNGGPVMTALKGQGVATIPTLGRLNWLAGALRAQAGGLLLELHANGDALEAKSYAPKLVNTAPRGALAFVSLANLGRTLETVAAQPQVRSRLGPFAAPRGSSGKGSLVGDVVHLLGGEIAIYLRAATPFPEITAVLEQSDTARALRTVDSLVSRFGDLVGRSPVTEADVGGVRARRVGLGEYGLYYAAVQGNLVVTDVASGIESLGATAPKFGSDPVFRSAQRAAGMPAETTGFFFVNLRDALPLLRRLRPSDVPPDVAANLKPLQAALVYGTADGDTLSVRAFLQVS